MKYTVAIAAAALGLAGSAAAADPCFRTNDMKNHTILDDHTLYVGVGTGEVWRLGVKGNCLIGARSNDPLVVKTVGSSGMVCKPLDLDLSVKRGTIPTACLVDSVAKLSPEEIAKIPKGKKP
jgi:hypothetical protein